MAGADWVVRKSWQARSALLLMLESIVLLVVHNTWFWEECKVPCRYLNLVVQVVMVTGASSGIGRELAVVLNRKGARSVKSNDQYRLFFSKFLLILWNLEKLKKKNS